MFLNSMYKAVLLSFITVILLACSHGEQSNDLEAQLDPFARNKLLARSINLGNALDAPSEGEWGVTLQESYFKVIKEAGFTAVRIPIRWSAHAAVDSPFTIDADFAARVDWALDQAEKKGLAAIINIHHYNELFQDPAAHKARYLGLWKQIAPRYRDRPASVFFEILNEPHDQMTAEIWNEYLVDGLKIIRDSNPFRTVIIGTAEWGGIHSLEKLVLPEQDKNIIVTVHYYNPFHFTHQGAEWTEGSAEWLGTTWGSPEDQQAVEKDLDGVVAWAKTQQRPIFLGEFGAYKRADLDSRVKYTTFVARACEAREISWAYWEFCASFGAYDAEKNAWREPLLKALIPGE